MTQFCFPQTVLHKWRQWSQHVPQRDWLLKWELPHTVEPVERSKKHWFSWNKKKVSLNTEQSASATRKKCFVKSQPPKSTIRPWVQVDYNMQNSKGFPIRTSWHIAFISFVKSWWPWPLTFSNEQLIGLSLCPGEHFYHIWRNSFRDWEILCLQGQNCVLWLWPWRPKPKQVILFVPNLKKVHDGW